VSRRIDVIDATSRTVWSWHLQYIWRDVVQQLQRWLCVPCWLDVVDTASCDMPIRYVQCVWSDVVQ
jgi:hypothetical protein